ncbi:MAG: DUF924 family protein [Steroidobacteraceae bacterium]
MTGAPQTAHRAQDILDFWFGPDPLGAGEFPQRLRLWFGDDEPPELTQLRDESLVARFGATLDAAARGELDAWAGSPRRLLALILLLDPLPRQAFRGKARAYARDLRAMELCLTGMATGADAALAPVERLFLYLPLQHAESLELQEESIAAYRRLASEAPPAHRGLFDACVDLAMQHHQTIARFGRFPHRNAVLGRRSTAEELSWLSGESG